MVIPQRDEEGGLALAFEKVKGERKTRSDLQRDDKWPAAFARYGILSIGRCTRLEARPGRIFSSVE